MLLFDVGGYAPEKREGMRESFKTDKDKAQRIAQAVRSLHWPDNYEVVDSPQQMRRIRDLLSAHGDFVIDTETSGLNPWFDRVLGISLEVGGHVFIMPTEHRLLKNVPPEAIRRYLGEALCDPNVRRINHNLKFDLAFLHTNFKVPVGRMYCDTLIMSQVINPDNQSPHGLKELCSLYGLADNTGNYTAQFGKTAWSHIDPKLACYYAGKDVELVRKLFAKQNETLALPGKEKLRSLFWDVEMPIANLVLGMEQRGMRVDREYIRKKLVPTVYQEYAKAIEALRPHVEPYAKAVDSTFPEVLESPTKLEKIYFDHLKVPLVKWITLRKDNHGAFTKRTLDKDAISGLFRTSVPMRLLSDYRKWATLKKMFIDVLPKMVVDGRIHPTINPIGAGTGRMSMSSPNLQQIPSRMGALVRNTFIPDDGNIFMSADFSSQEMRILAYYSNDNGLRGFFTRPDALDPYSETAIMVMSKKDATFDIVGFRKLPKEQRKATPVYKDFKSLVLGLGYGLGAASYGRKTGISTREAEANYNLYHEAFPGVKRYQDKAAEFARENGYITTLLGRQRPLPNIHSNLAGIRSGAERAAANTPIQGTAADMVKKAALDVQALIDREQWPVWIILMIHDELLLEMSAAWARANPDAITKITTTMENALPLGTPGTASFVPMKSSATFETRWGSEITADELDDFLDDLAA